jgi:histidine triad (HIT) family protein
MEDCIFCKIIAKQAESQIVFEDAEMIAFKDIRPKAPVHMLVVPKKHFVDLNAATPADTELIGHMLLRAAAIAKDSGIDQSGYKVVTNTGDDGGQIIHHFHLHVVGGEPIKVSI